MELFDKLGIDWKLFLAQIINFGVLTFILFRFLYKPVLGVLEKRRRQVEENDTRSKVLEERVLESDKTYKEKIIEAERKVQNILKNAEAAAREIREKAVSQAQIEAEGIIMQARQRSEDEREVLINAVRKEGQNLVREAVRKIFYSMADDKTAGLFVEKAEKEIKQAVIN